MRTEPWWTQAACNGVDPETFFPVADADVQSALSICRRCDVLPQCKEYAATVKVTDGVWHGKFYRNSNRALRRDVRELAQTGMSVEEIAETVGVRVATVIGWIKEWARREGQQ